MQANINNSSPRLLGTLLCLDDETMDLMRYPCSGISFIKVSNKIFCEKDKGFFFSCCYCCSPVLQQNYEHSRQDQMGNEVVCLRP